METLSCHSNESSWTLKIKNITFVKGNVLSKYAKFQLHPPYAKKKNVEYFFENLPYMSPRQSIK